MIINWRPQAGRKYAQQAYFTSVDYGLQDSSVGDGGVAPPTNTFPMGGAGHPTGIYWGVTKHKRFTKDLNWLMDRVVSEYYEELTEPESPAKVQKEAAKIVRPYAKDGEKVPQQVNWQALYQDTEAVMRLLELYQRERALEDDEEQWMMLH